MPDHHTVLHPPQKHPQDSQQRDSRDSPSRHSPIAPLAPLEYLQNQRRGSITDPSLHAAPTPSSAKIPRDNQPSVSKPYPSDPRPSSPYIFGDATHSIDSNPQIRKLLRSPSTEHSNPRQDSHGSPRSNPTALASTRPGDSMQMHVDNERREQQNHIRRSSRELHQFDYTMRRHSIAVGQESPTQPFMSHGTKRKMSADRSTFPTVGEEIDPQLVGPGVPSVMEVDTDVPASKRRGSAIDTQRIAQLSLSDRRNSVDSRGAPQWWMNDRRDSSSSMFSNVSSLGGYSSGFPGNETRTPPGIATFAWPASSHPPDHSDGTAVQGEVDPDMAGGSRTFDPTSQIGMMPPMNFVNDRRMSMPDNHISAGPTRILRSRSRPPSRGMHSTEPNSQSGPSSGQDDPASAPSPTGSGKHSKESSATPYSRSPELRVSHKLAERKRRKEMKDLFDELRDQLPADRGMKASKWEILSKAIDFVAQLKQSHQDMARDIEIMRRELEAVRQGGIASFPPGGPPPPHAVVYGQGPSLPPQFPAPLAGTMQQHQPPIPQPHPSTSRPGSSHNAFPSGNGPPAPSSQNGNTNRVEAPPT